MTDLTRHQLTAFTVSVLGVAGTLLAPPRLRPILGLTLGAYIAAEQAAAIRMTNAGALAAAERGGRRWTAVATDQFMHKARLDQLEAAVADMLVGQYGSLESDEVAEPVKAAGVRTRRRTYNALLRLGLIGHGSEPPMREVDLHSGNIVIHPSKPRNPITYLPELGPDGI